MEQKPQVLFLVTNGDFPDNKAVLEWLAMQNRNRAVVVNTVAFVRVPDDDPDFIDLLRDIAGQNGGQFRMIPADGAARPN
jgi:hypothetical protein